MAGSGYGTSHSFSSADNRVTTSGYSYDGSGDLMLNGSGTYNWENLMTAFGASVSYTYDAQGRRASKTVSSTRTDYFYVGSEVIAEKQGANWTDSIFFGGGQRIATQTGSSATTATYLHGDHLGSVRVTTNSSGSSSGTCSYEPYGEAQGTDCNSFPSTYRFTGAQLDSETGLYHFWFRQYDAAQGRWMGVDRLAGNTSNPQSLNRYPYVTNNPVNLFDPLGLESDAGYTIYTTVGLWLPGPRPLPPLPPAPTPLPPPSSPSSSGEVQYPFSEGPKGKNATQIRPKDSFGPREHQGQPDAANNGTSANNTTQQFNNSPQQCAQAYNSCVAAAESRANTCATFRGALALGTVEASGMIAGFLVGGPLGAIEGIELAHPWALGAGAVAAGSCIAVREQAKVSCAQQEITCLTH